MAERLKSINESADPFLCYHMNTERAAMLAQQIASAPAPQQGPLKFQYANELLNSGQTEEAIAALEALLAEIAIADSDPIPPQVRAIYEITAIAYMRLGEQQNCVLQHSSESCIFPIEGAGVHQLPRGSAGAIKIYERLLESDPTDLQSRYLLNVAHMTLGQHPASVPEEFLLDTSTFASDNTDDFPHFVDVGSGAGVGVTGLSGGCCVEDFDSDGLLDVFATAYGVGEQARLFRNQGDGRFQDVTERAGLIGIVGGLNAIHADYDNDGHPDILVLRGGWLGQGGKRPASLLRNLGDGRFSDVTFSAGLTSLRPTQTASWGDFDGDGWLDLFIGNESKTDRAGATLDDFPCELYRNNQDGTFSEIAADVGLDLRAFVKGTVWGDVDGDGWIDLYVSVLGGQNKLFRNKLAADGNSRTFVDTAKEAGVQEPFFSFPTWFFDYDNDGDSDLFVSGYDVRRLGKAGGDFGAELAGADTPAERSRLYRNRGDGTFELMGAEEGLSDVTYTMGSNFGDIDMDGFLDVYLGTGAPDFRSLVPNKMYRNVGGARFEDVTTVGGFGHLQKGHGVAFADLDNDGDQDVYAVMGGAYEGDTFQNALFENPGFDRSWITLQIEGTTANRSSIGAKISVRATEPDGSTRVVERVVTTGGSFGSSSLQQEIGLGTAVAIESIKVQWPSPDKTERTYTNLDLKERYRLVESSGDVEKTTSPHFKLGSGDSSTPHDHSQH